MKLILTLLTFSLATTAFAGTAYTVASSTVSADEARQHCSVISATTGLPGGRSVGYFLRAGNTFFTVCERYYQDYDNNFDTLGMTFTVSVSNQSFEHARWQCQQPSSTTGLPGGRHTGFPLQQQNNVFAVVCLRPQY